MNRITRAIDFINQEGFLLVFPIKNSSTPNSLWHCMHPTTVMLWEWTDEADNKVAELWHLRNELAESKEVIYGKYFRGRATFFSKTVFRDLMAIKQSALYQIKNREAKLILEALNIDSPLSTKQIKEAAELKGKLFEPLFNKNLKELWQNLLVVAIGEIDDGAFPSLAHGATQTVFEDLWQEAISIDIADAWMRLCDLKEFEILEYYFLREKE